MKMISSLIFFLAFSFIGFAQESTTVTEKTEKIGAENGSVLSVKINRASEKEILKEWKSKMKDYEGEIKVKKTLITSSSVKIESIDANPIEVLAQTRRATEQEHELLVMFIKNGQPISSSSSLSSYTAAKSIVMNFATTLSKNATEEYQKNQTKTLEKLQKELDNAIKDKEKAEKTIADANKAIKEAEKTIREKTKFIADNEKSQAGLLKKLDNQKKLVKAANDEMDLFK